MRRPDWPKAAAAAAAPKSAAVAMSAATLKKPPANPRPFRQPYCSSEDFYRWLETYYPFLLVAEHAAIYLGEGIPLWGPHREAEAWAEDGACLECGGRDLEGSILVCPRCQRSGVDRQLGRQLDLAGYPMPEPPPRLAPTPYVVPVPTDPVERWWRSFAWTRQGQKPPGARPDAGRRKRTA
jgi:hypothetical protein